MTPTRSVRMVVLPRSGAQTDSKEAQRLVAEAVAAGGDRDTQIGGNTALQHVQIQLMQLDQGRQQLDGAAAAAAGAVGCQCAVTASSPVCAVKLRLLAGQAEARQLSAQLELA